MQVIESTITVGNLITIAVDVLTVAGALIGIYLAQQRFNIRSSERFSAHSSLVQERLGVVGGRLVNVENEIREISRIVTVQAVQTNQIKAIERGIEELRREMNHRFAGINDRLTGLDESNRTRHK